MIRISKKLAGGLIAAMLLLLAQSNGVAEPGSNGIGGRVAGSYLVRADLVGIPIPLQALATLGADGGAIATDTDDFGNGARFGFHSPKQGVWKETGKQQITIKVLEFAYDPSGALTTVYKLTFVAQFDDKNYQTGAGEVKFDAYLPFQNVLDPDEIPVASGEGTFSFQRINL